MKKIIVLTQRLIRDVLAFHWAATIADTQLIADTFEGSALNKNLTHT